MPIHRAVMLKAVTVLCCLPLMTCGQHTTEQSVVLFERGAELRLAIESQTWKSDAPWLMTLGEGEMLTVRNALRSTEVRAEPGQLLVVSRALQISSYPLGTVVAPNQLRVQGSRAAVEELAGLLNATVEADGAGAWALVGDELFERFSFLEAPQGISAVEPRLIPWPINMASDSSVNAAEVERFTRLSSGERVATVVGLYTTSKERLLLNASGEYERLTPAGRCGDYRAEERGQYTVEKDGVITFSSIRGERWQVRRDASEGALVSLSGERYQTVLPAP